MEFVALISTGKGGWGQIAGLVKNGEWDKIVLIGDDYMKKFEAGKEKGAEYVFVRLSQPISLLKDELLRALKGKLRGAEVALSIASGSGKEHMALISALLQLPVGIRFVALTKEGVVEL